MLYLVALAIPVLVGLVAIRLLAKRAFTLPETYTKRHRGVGGQITFCQHCDNVITPSNRREHGVNCARRPKP
ncbi:MAG: hypothetical protein ACE149_13250 [Armatimonadota bacterium]